VVVDPSNHFGYRSRLVSVERIEKSSFVCFNRTDAGDGTNRNA
jgi:hypothetical protein